MISWASIWAVVLRNLRLWRRDPNLALGAFCWPLLDIITWGYLGAWIAQSQCALLPHYDVVALLGILLWQVVGRGCNLLGFALCEEFWSRNIVNLFSLPLRLAEWIVGVILYSSLMIIVTCCFCMFAILCLYNVSLWHIITTYALFFAPLLLCMIWVGFMCLSIFVVLGRRGIEFGFIIGWFLTPFSGAYYPLEVLPTWAQKVSALLPMSYLFKGLREYVMYGHNPTAYIIKGTVLGFFYATGAIALFIWCFTWSKKRGLARLAD